MRGACSGWRARGERESESRRSPLPTFVLPLVVPCSLIFYFCHPAALYINKMHEAGLVGATGGRQRWRAGGGVPACVRVVAQCAFHTQSPRPSTAEHVHPYYQKVFETGVDEMSWDDMDVMQVRRRSVDQSPCDIGGQPFRLRAHFLW